MWKLEHISAINICSFRELEYSPQQGVTTLIFGQNTDNENQQSNGSGKSTLIEAIALGITGSPLRKVRSEEIINDSAEDCYVQLRFTNADLGERLIIEREFFRKGSSNVIVTVKTADGEQEISQPSVDAYNKYILDKIGITRDELFSSFVLSKHRYQDFLSSPDKDKKEIINRFSNGVMVDSAIEKLAQDIAPIRDELREVDLEFAAIDGRIEMLSEQIRSEEENGAERERSKEEKLSAIQTTIAEKRGIIRACGDGINYQNTMAASIEGIDSRMQDLENSTQPLEDIIEGVRSEIAPIAANGITDWSKIIRTKKTEIDDFSKEIDKWMTIIGTTRQKIAVAERDLIQVRKECEVFEQQAGEKYEAVMQEMDELKDRLEQANDRIETLKKRKRTLSGVVETLQAKLAGAVTCPSCQHQFLVTDTGFDMEAARVELDNNLTSLDTASENLLDSELEAEKVEQMQTHLRNEIRGLSRDKEQWTDKFQKAQRNVQAAEYEMEGNQFNLKRIQDFITDRTTEVEDIRRSIFDEAYELIDAARRLTQQKVAQFQEKIAAAESSIDTLRQTADELKKSSGSELIASLRDTLKTYRKKSAEVAVKKTTIESRLNTLIEQEQVFIQFKSYLANTKIQALSGMMNQILTDLGSDIRVNFSGYTVLKSGAIREKISISLIRDGVDCGSFGKFSEGEKMRVNLSSIIAMQRLVNGNCDFGKGLDLLVIDELGDSLDETGLASTFSAINKLGLTALVVSHGLTNEGYPYKLQIVKENGESRIDHR